MKLEDLFNKLKALDPEDKIELYISSKLLGLKDIRSYEDLGIRYNRYNNRAVVNSELIGAMETLYTRDQEEWQEHRQKVMEVYVKIISCKIRQQEREGLSTFKGPEGNINQGRGLELRR